MEHYHICTSDEIEKFLSKVCKTEDEKLRVWNIINFAPYPLNYFFRVRPEMALILSWGNK